MRMALLTPGVHRYARYFVKDGRRVTMDIWTRRIAYEPREGQRRLHISMRWEKEVAPAYQVDQDAWLDAATFRPLTHTRTLIRDGKTTVGGYRFGSGAVVGMAELADNSREDFRLETPEPAFNFEYDMELLQTLPWRKGYVTDLAFYDSGLERSRQYAVRYEREESRTGPDGKLNPCWVVTADYNTGKVASRFWLARSNQLVIHEEGEHDGVIYVNTLIGAESADKRAGLAPAAARISTQLARSRRRALHRVRQLCRRAARGALGLCEHRFCAAGLHRRARREGGPSDLYRQPHLPAAWDARLRLAP